LGEPPQKKADSLKNYLLFLCRRAIRCITFTASLRLPFRWFRFYPSRASLRALLGAKAWSFLFYF
jgi:hypothetical protein